MQGDLLRKIRHKLTRMQVMVIVVRIERKEEIYQSMMITVGEGKKSARA